MTNFEEFREALSFANKYDGKEYLMTLYETSADSCLVSITDRSNGLIDGAILYYNGDKWVVLNNNASYVAVSSYISYLECCDYAFSEANKDEEDLGGIEL